jgi:Acetyltransferase (GNAT) domain
MTIVSREQLGREAWDGAVEASPEAWLWHRYDVCDATIRDWEGRSDAGFALLSDRAEVEAVVPGFILERRTRFGLPVRNLESFGGPALSTTLGRSRRRTTLDAIAAELQKRAAASRALRATISLPPMAPALRGPTGPRCNPLLYLGCSDVSGQTWVMDLRDGVDAVWGRLEGRARTNIRRAETAGMTARPSRSADDWQHFYELHKVTYARLGVPSYPAALFHTIFERLIPAELCWVLFAELNGRVVAAQNIACYKQGGYYWHGFATDLGLESNAMTFLLWQSIKMLISSGKAHWFDCGEAVVGAGAGDGKMRKLSDFKKSFGGELYPHFRGQINGSSKLYNRLLHLKGLVSGQ